MADGKKNTVSVIWDLAEPLAKQLGLILWDVRFLKEGTDWHLRLIIDREDRPVDIDDCVNMSHAIDEPLDELDPIQQSYSLQVQSPGIERELTRDFHFERYIGSPVMVKLIHAADGVREFKGTLVSYDNGNIEVKKQDGSGAVFNKKDASWVKLDDFGGFEENE